MTVSDTEKINLLKTLNWDYIADPVKMLSVVEGKIESTGSFDKRKLFVRSLERLPWHHVVRLWGINQAIELYTEETACMLWPAELRRRYDFVFRVLRKEPVSAAGWGPEQRREMQNTILSNRWYRTESGFF